MFFWLLAGGRDGEGLEQYQVIPEPPKWKVSTIVKEEHDKALCPKGSEWERLVEYLRDEIDPRNEESVRNLALVLTAGTAGLRRSDLAHLTWDDLTFAPDGSQVAILVRRGKWTKDRETVGSGDAAAALLALRERQARDGNGKEDQPVFGFHGRGRDAKTRMYTGEVRFQPIDLDTISALFLRWSARLHFHVTCHSLRHFASHVWIEAGMTPVDAKNLLGHTNIVTTQRYIDIEAASSLAKLGGIWKERAKDQKVVPLQPRRKKMPQPVATLAA